MRRQLLLVACGGAALVVAAALALLGRAVLSTPDAVGRAATSWPTNARVDADSGTLAERAAQHLLGAERVPPFARVVSIYRAAIGVAGQPTDHVRISKLIPELQSAQERAQAHVMAGILIAFSAGTGVGYDAVNQPGAENLLEQALEEFRSAVREDGRNEDAKYDLELLMKRQAKAQMPPQRQTKKEKKPRGQRSKTATQGLKQQEQKNSSEFSHGGVYATGSGY